MKTTSIACLGSLLLCASPSSAQGPAAVEPPVVIVQGEGLVRVAPDQAFVRIGAESRARNPKDAQAANAEAMTAVQQRLAAAGVPKDAVRTVAISLQQEFDYAGGRQTPRGYVARNSIEVRVDDLGRLGDVMDASVGSGATSIHGLRFDLKQRAVSEREALRLAVADAMLRADAAASGAKRAVDRVVRIAEGAPVAVVRPEATAFRAAAADQPATTPVAEGEIEIRARVTVTAAIR
ncbi:MAG: SIMPL domain-containing protein [Acidobacteria bacterium]|nr:SIMPL domain-containing protein [Acidobacteriota bacterium]